MTFLDYFCKELPAKCGHKGAKLAATGRVVRAVIDAEIKDPHFISAEDLTSRERAGYLLPYCPAKGFELQYSRGLMVAEAAILQHRKDHHGEDDLGQIESLTLEMTDEEKEVAARGWWSS